MKKLNILLLLLATYLISYLILSRNGYYMPIAFGSYNLDNKTVLASKNIGEKWIPFNQRENASVLWIIYSPLVFMDKLFWHQERSEDGTLKLRSDYPERR